MTAQILEFDPTKKEPVCAFCKTPKSKAKNMFKSTRVEKYICGICVAKCKALLNDNQGA